MRFLGTVLTLGDEIDRLSSDNADGDTFLLNLAEQIIDVLLQR